MAVKMKSVAVRPKAKTAKYSRKKGNIILNSEICFLRPRNDFSENLLNLKKTPNYEIFSVGKKRFYREKTFSENCQELDDIQLIQIAQNQNRDAYSDLFRRYQKKLFAYIFRLTRDREEAEDILQNVFIKTYKNIHHFDLNRKFSSWIYRIAHNEAVNYLKHKSKRYSISWEDVSTSKDKLEMASNDEPMEDRLLHLEITKEIDEALEKLPKQYREILDMRYFKEYSYQQIGKILDKPVNTVGTIINRAKKKLYEIVKADMEK
jgi:RNA polymerase sigma-70 factor, ECF subfamily